MHWFFKLWIFVVLIPCFAALAGILLHRIRGDYGLKRSAEQSGNSTRLEDTLKQRKKEVETNNEITLCR